jgi:cytochrome c oxidase subunit 2
MSSDQPVAHEPPVLAQGDSIIEGQPFFSRPTGKIFIIWFAMTTVGVLIGIFVPHHVMPTLLSHEATDVWRTIVLFTILAAPVAALVYAVAAYSLIAWRHRGNQEEPPEDGPPLRGNSTVTAIWLGTSTVLVLVLLAWGLSVYSADVTHGFWPVALGVQVDANPGVTTVIRATPDKLGNFTVRCSQLCGLYHSFMYAPGSVVTTAKFSQWLQSQGASTTTAEATALIKKR